jgi:putative ABC transport system permease protein
MIGDLRVAARVLRKSPGFTIVAVATLAIGIAATASLFSLVNGLVLDPLPYPHPEQLVEVWGKDVNATFDFLPLSTPDYLDLRERLSQLAAFGTFTVRRFNLGGAQAESIEGVRCNAGLLRALEVPPLHGRWFAVEDESSDAALVILSHGLWARRFASDPGVIGRTVRLDGREHTIVGVMPEGFRLLSQWTRNRSLGLFTLMPLRPSEGGRATYWMASIARLKPGVSIAAAGAELREAARQIAQLNPDTSARRTFWLMPLARQVGGMPALRVSVLLCAGWTLLVLAGQNVAGMLLARGLGRQSEMAIRAALGARRAQIARLAVAESLLLSVGAAACGFVLTLWCLRALPRILPVEVLPRTALHVDGWLLGCILVLTLIVAQMAGTAPALLAARTDSLALRESGGGAGGARRVRRKLRSLVIGQTVAAIVLVSVALQLSSTYRQMVASARVAASDRVLTAALAVKGARYDDAGRIAFWEQLLVRTTALPGVLGAAVTTKLPFDGGVCMRVLIDDEAFNAQQLPPFTEVSYVSPTFFAAIGASLYQGRPLSAADTQVRYQSVVINRAMAERYWPARSPIGRRIRPAVRDSAWSATVVGVIADMRQVAERPAKPEMYFPFGDWPGEAAFLVIRSVPGAAAPIAAVRDELGRIDPDLALAEIRTMEDRYADGSRVFATVTAIVDGLTIAVLGLAGLGLYGSLSFHFAQRRREIGVRLALGAHGRDIALLVLRQALAWLAVGGAIGVTLAALIATGLRAAIQDASAVDVVQLATSLAVVATAALAAAYLPARRAAKVDPMVALRCE